MPINNFNINGLNTEEVKLAKEKFGLNQLNYKQSNQFFDALKRIVQEPMMVLLFAAASIYL